MNPYAADDTAFYVALVLIVFWQLPIWGRRVLDFLRDLRSFRNGD